LQILHQRRADFGRASQAKVRYKQPMNLRRTLHWTGGYLGLLLVTIFISASFWEHRVNGVMYYCSKPLPSGMEFLEGPPFAHRNWGQMNIPDYYLAPASRVIQLWWALWASCLVLPAVLLWLGHRAGKYFIRLKNRHAGAPVAPEPQSTEIPTGTKFGSRLALYFVHLYWTALAIVLVGLIILFRNILSYASPRQRHQPDFSDATINNRPQLVLVGNCGELSTVAFSPDGKRIATGAGTAVAQVWDSSSGAPLMTLTRPDQDGYFEVRATAFSPDGRHLAVSGHTHEVIIYDAQTGQIVRTLEGLDNHGSGVAFSADSRSLATANADGVQVWEIQTGRQLLNLNEFTESARCVAFSPDGQRLAAGANDWTVRVWDARTGKRLLIFKGHYADVWRIAFSPDSKRIASACRDNSVKVWDAITGQEIVTFTGHREQVFGVAFCPDGKRVASIGRDGVARVWDASNAREFYAFDIMNKDPYVTHLGVAFSPDGKRLATAIGGNVVKVWNVGD
jgi:Tol biopolymer transport system component